MTHSPAGVREAVRPMAREDASSSCARPGPQLHSIDHEGICYDSALTRSVVKKARANMANYT